MTRSARVAAAALAGLAVACVIAPLLLSGDPHTVDPANTYAGPSAAHWLGTDDLGRDVLVRLFLGGRVSLAVALVGALASVLLGGVVGAVSGYFGGVIDAALSRLTEAMMALPRLPLMIVLLAIDLGSWARIGGGLLPLIVIVVLFGWTSAARLARASAQQLRDRPFVLAARGLGASHARILWRHILPNAAAPLIVVATIDVGHVVLYESVLSYLGLGIQPPSASWGAMLHEGMTYLHTAPMLLIAPGLLTFATVVAVNVLGDGLREALDPSGPA